MLGLEKSKKLEEPRFEGSSPRIAIIQSNYHSDVAEALQKQVKAKLGNAFADFETLEFPGILDLAPALAMSANSGRFHGYIVLGSVVYGENGEAAVYKESLRAISSVAAQGHPVGTALLWADTKKKLTKLASKRSDLGGAAASAALHLIALERRLAGTTPASSFKPAETHIIMADEPPLTGPKQA